MRTSDVSELIGSLQADELNQLDNQVREVIRGVMRTGQAGAVTVKITVKRNSENSVQFAVQATTKVPKPAPGAGIKFVALDDGLNVTGELRDASHKQESLFAKNENITPIRKGN